MADDSAPVQKIRLTPGQWVDVKFSGWVPREGTLPGATVYLRLEAEPLANELGRVFGFSHIDGLTISQGKTYQDAPDRPEPEQSRAIPVRRRDPAEAAERIRAGYRDAGIPEDVAEAMIEETLRDA